jgi:hydrogenase expression/formation protein HypC
MCLGIPGEILEVEEADGLRFAKVRFGEITRLVCLECQPDAGIGDFVLVHVGLAIARIDREEAARTWQALVALGQTGDVTEDTTAAPADEAADRA